MKRREFFGRLMPFGSQARELARREAPRSEEETTPLTENELFLHAMAHGIDPATVTLEQLETMISKSAPSTTL